MMCFFYTSIFPSIFIIELPAIILLYAIAKYMLLRICKSPAGLSVRLNSLAQSVLKSFIPLAWLGKSLLLYFAEEDDTKNKDFF